MVFESRLTKSDPVIFWSPHFGAPRPERSRDPANPVCLLLLSPCQPPCNRLSPPRFLTPGHSRPTVRDHALPLTRLGDGTTQNSSRQPILRAALTDPGRTSVRESGGSGGWGGGVGRKEVRERAGREGGRERRKEEREEEKREGWRKEERMYGLGLLVSK